MPTTNKPPAPGKVESKGPRVNKRSSPPRPAPILGVFDDLTGMAGEVYRLDQAGVKPQCRWLGESDRFCDQPATVLVAGAWTYCAEHHALRCTAVRARFTGKVAA